MLLHGLALSHLTWVAITDALAEQFTVYTLDLPGFGYSDKPAGYASARQAAAFVDRFLATLGLEHVTLIGPRWAARQRCGRRPSTRREVERLVLVNAAEIGEAAAIFRLLARPIVGDLLLKTTSSVSMRMLMSDPYVQKQVVTPEVATASRLLVSPSARRALIEQSARTRPIKRRYCRGSGKSGCPR